MYVLLLCLYEIFIDNNLQFNVATGISPPMMRPHYKAYKSPYGPK